MVSCLWKVSETGDQKNPNNNSSGGGSNNKPYIAFYVPSMILNSLCIWTHLILTTVLWDVYYYYPLVALLWLRKLEEKLTSIR